MQKDAELQPKELGLDSLHGSSKRNQQLQETEEEQRREPPQSEPVI